MRSKWIPALVMLLAGFIACIITIVNHYDNTAALTIILVTLIVFYIVGCVIQVFSNKFLVVEQPPEENEEIEIDEEGNPIVKDETEEGKEETTEEAAQE